MSATNYLNFDLSYNSGFETEVNVKSNELASAGKAVRQHHIRNIKGVTAHIAACIEIQRIYRGYLLRKSRANVKSIDQGRGQVAQPARSDSKKHSYSADQSRRSGLPLRLRTSDRRSVKSVRTQQQPKASKIVTRLDAVVRIQRWWRSILDMNVYQYYRDLLNFRQRGDPALMLRCINPAEAKLADSAAGIHVKFRLAGLQRKADVEKRRKQKKIDWMRKIYKHATNQANGNGSDVAAPVKSATDSQPVSGFDELEDSEVQELLDWSASLDFDEYWIHWKELGTSAPSEAPTLDRLKLKVASNDPFGLLIDGANQKSTLSATVMGSFVFSED